jgi:hypothetical protein
MHGTRTLTIVDPEWEHPTVEVPDPEWERPLIHIPDPTWEPVEGEEAPLLDVPDATAVAPLITVPDMSIEAKTIEIDNPDCMIPDDAVEITADEHAALLEAQAQGATIEADGSGRPVIQPRPAPTWADIVAAKMVEINDACEKEIATISAGYPVSEVLSWSKQEAEARAYLADISTPTPLLDALSTARTLTKAEMAPRIVTKADVFAEISGALIGKRHRLEDQIEAVPEGDYLALEMIKW